MYYSELQKGTEVAGRYVLKECKGSGSFGEVWLAKDKVLDIDVAIKLYISLDQKGQDEFKDEYKVAYGLNHQYLLTTHFYGVWEHRPYLIMKYCSQGSAANLAGSISENRIWKFIHDVASGLEYLHTQDPPIIHQDIKPANILIDEQGNFLITDFGISKKMRTTMRKQSKRAMESGAIAYMGPERFLANPMAVMASDIWSLGASVYELATDELPFMGQGGGMLNAGAFMPVLESQWSRNLNKVMQLCLAKETWDRPVAQDLAAYADLMLKGENLSWEEWKNGGGKPPKPKDMSYWVTVAIFVVLGGGFLWFIGTKVSGIMQLKQRTTRLIQGPDNIVKIEEPKECTALLEAQEMFERATTVEEFTDAKKKFESARYDINYFAVKHEADIQEGIRKCEERINELKPRHTKPRLTVNGDSNSISFDSGGGIKVLTIDTNQGTVSASELPTWIDVINNTSASLTIRCEKNGSTSSRRDWFNVNAGSLTVRIDVSQSGKTFVRENSSSSNKSAPIQTVWVEHNTQQQVGGEKGLTVHVKFRIIGLKGAKAMVAAYFYDSQRKAIKDLNNFYCTSEDVPKVASHINITPRLDNTLYEDCKIFIPYKELHQTGSYKRKLFVDVKIWDFSTSGNELFGEMKNIAFDYTPPGR